MIARPSSHWWHDPLRSSNAQPPGWRATSVILASLLALALTIPSAVQPPAVVARANLTTSIAQPEHQAKHPAEHLAGGDGPPAAVSVADPTSHDSADQHGAGHDPTGPVPSPTMAMGFQFMAALDACLATPGCPTIAELLALTQPDVRQTTIRADGSLHTRDGQHAVRTLLADELAARGLVGAEAIVMVTQEQNLVGTQRFHYASGAPDHYGTFMLQLQSGRIAHWVVCLAPLELAAPVGGDL